MPLLLPPTVCGLRACLDRASAQELPQAYATGIVEPPPTPPHPSAEDGSALPLPASSGGGDGGSGEGGGGAVGGGDMAMQLLAAHACSIASGWSGSGFANAISDGQQLGGWAEAWTGGLLVRDPEAAERLKNPNKRSKISPSTQVRPSTLRGLCPSVGAPSVCSHPALPRLASVTQQALLDSAAAGIEARHAKGESSEPWNLPPAPVVSVPSPVSCRHCYSSPSREWAAPSATLVTAAAHAHHATRAYPTLCDAGGPSKPSVRKSLDPRARVPKMLLTAAHQRAAIDCTRAHAYRASQVPCANARPLPQNMHT